MHLCTCVSEEGADGEGTVSEASSLLSCTLIYVSLADLSRMARQYLAVPATSASPERFFSRVGLVQTDLCGSLLDTTMIDLMWAKQAP